MPTPDLVVPGAGVLTLRWTYGGGTIGGFNVLGVVIQGATVVNQTLANTLDTAVKNALTSSGFISHLHSATALVSVGIRDIRAANLVEFIGSGAAVPGTGTGDPLPRQTALVISLRTDFAGAKYRGRVYLGGFAEADNDTTANAASAVGTTGVAFINAIGAALRSNGCDHGVLSRPGYATTTTKTIVVPGGTNVTETKTTAARPGAINVVRSIIARNNIWDSQRRRTSAGSVSTLFAPFTAVAEAGGEVMTPAASQHSTGRAAR